MNERAKLLNLIIKDVYNGVSADDILEIVYRQIAPGQVEAAGIKIGDRLLDAGEIMQLKYEADQFKNSKLWKLVSERMQYHAQIRLSKDAADKDDILLPKYIIWTIQSINEVVKTLCGFEQRGEQKSTIITGAKKVK